VAGIKTSQLIVFSNDQLKAFTVTQVPALATAGLTSLSVSQADAFTGTQVAAMSVTQTMALPSGSVNYATPLILDLDGNGVQTQSIAAGVQFDIRGEGKAVHTGWVDAHDGLLALDRNGDGVINDGGELFGSATALADGSKAGRLRRPARAGQQRRRPDHQRRQRLQRPARVGGRQFGRHQPGR
jgi:hypothetical protein